MKEGEREREYPFWFKCCTFAGRPVPPPCIGGEARGCPEAVPSGELPLPFPAVLELNIPVATLLQELLRGLRAITEGGDFESLLPCERPGKCKSFFLQAAERGETHVFADSSFAYLATAISQGDLTG